MSEPLGSRVLFVDYIFICHFIFICYSCYLLLVYINISSYCKQENNAEKIVEINNPWNHDTIEVNKKQQLTMVLWANRVLLDLCKNVNKRQTFVNKQHFWQIFSTSNVRIFSHQSSICVNNLYWVVNNCFYRKG